MRSAVIVSTARTPIGRAYRGAFNDTQAQALGGHVDRRRRSSAPASTRPRSTTSSSAPRCSRASQGFNIARQSALRAGLPDTRRRHVGRPAMRLGPDGDRHRRQGDHRTTACRSRSAAGSSRSRWCRTTHVNRYRAQDPELVARMPGALHDDDRDRRDRRRALRRLARGAGRIRAALAAAHRRGAAGRAASTTRSCRCRRRCW